MSMQFSRFSPQEILAGSVSPELAEVFGANLEEDFTVSANWDEWLDRGNRNRSTIGRAPCSRAAVLTLETPSKRSKTGRLSFVAAALFETY
jgi:hypothetical protein